MRNRDGDVIAYDDDGGMLGSLEGAPHSGIRIGQVVTWHYGNPNSRFYGYVVDIISPTTAWVAYFGGGGYTTHAIGNLRRCPEFVVLDPERAVQA